MEINKLSLYNIGKSTSIVFSKDRITNIKKIIEDQIKADKEKFTNQYIYAFDLNINSINFGNVRLNTYNGSGWDHTHINKLNFQNISIKYNYKITKQKI